MDKRHELGRRGEDLSAARLEALGYKLTDRNHVFDMI
jgi:Holliday junction resolvase-like predicted endonuclease